MIWKQIAVITACSLAFGANGFTVIINGTTLLPAEAIVEAIGGQVQWNKALKTIGITTATETVVADPIAEEVKINC